MHTHRNTTCALLCIPRVYTTNMMYGYYAPDVSVCISLGVREPLFALYPKVHRPSGRGPHVTRLTDPIRTVVYVCLHSGDTQPCNCHTPV